MAHFTIRIDYEDGDSFGVDRDVGHVGMIWSNIDGAKKALEMIKDHYNALRYITKDLKKVRRMKGPDEYQKEGEKFCQSIRTQPWFYYDSHTTFEELSEKVFEFERFLMVPNRDYDETNPTNSDQWVPINAFWNGHFEKLIKASIVIDDSNGELEFEPYGII